MKKLSLFVSLFIFPLAYGQQEIVGSTPSLPLEVLITPNPHTDYCRIEAEEGAICTVFSSEGTYIGKWRIDESRTVLLTDLPLGLLFVTIEKDQRCVRKKILVL